ncbi:MAG TPA: septal ring lytic transglycosylase RlpA family protein [Rhodanobacteraceae bacterium]|nr:septal ring lytic transglycosylase RlpA family protein [Rhodanobacteraceae bacterium]
MSRRAAQLLPLVLLLAGCSREAVRPTPPPAGAPTAGAPGHAGVIDNISLPQSQRYAQARDGSPAEPRDVRDLVEPVPHAEPRSRYGNTSPYTVRGHTYHVLATASGYDERGIASWYGTKFNGHLTSSLEPYDMYKFTAAHKTLPLPSWARVTNLDNGNSVIVRINDRGPFHPGRIIDLSYAAAVRLGIWRQGTGRVEVQAIIPGRSPELSPNGAVTSAAGAHIFLQVGSFADRDNADRLAARLRALDVGPVQVLAAVVDGRTLQRVRVGPLRDQAQARRLRQQIQRSGLPLAQTILE